MRTILSHTPLRMTYSNKQGHLFRPPLYYMGVVRRNYSIDSTYGHKLAVAKISRKRLC